MNNIKAKHELDQMNYKRLGIFSRLIILVFDVTSLINVVIVTAFNAITAIRSRQLFWIFEATLFMPIYVICIFSPQAICIIFILILYYVFRFGQINTKIKSINNFQIFNKSKQRQLNKLINEHNSLAIEIHKLNLVLRRFTASMFIFSSLTKIMKLFSLIYMNNSILIVWSIAVFIMYFTFGFGLSYLFTRQIKSAHCSYKIIHSIVCKHKIKL